MSRIAMNMPKHIRLKPNQVATRAFVVRQTVIARCASSSQLARGGAPGECLRIAKLRIAKSVKARAVEIADRGGNVYGPAVQSPPGNSPVVRCNAKSPALA